MDFGKGVYVGDGVCSGKSEAGRPELTPKRVIFIDISIGRSPAFITPAVADWGLNQHFSPSVNNKCNKVALRSAFITGINQDSLCYRRDFKLINMLPFRLLFIKLSDRKSRLKAFVIVCLLILF